MIKKTIAITFIFAVLIVLSTALFQEKTRKPASVGKAPADYGLDNDIIYYIMIDRFYDSNYQNNVPNWAYPLDFQSKSKDPESAAANNDQRFWANQMVDWSKEKKFQHYWGGDLQGVIHKLPYLKEMGITTVLISPINDNVNGMFYNNGNSAYHGYWTKDWFRIEEHFANPPSGHIDLQDALRGNELVKNLTSIAHDMGMKILLDLSLNQSSPIQSQHNPFYFLEHGVIYKDGKKLLQYCYPNPGSPKNKDICAEEDDHYICGNTLNRTRINKGQNVTCEKRGSRYYCGGTQKQEIKGPCKEFENHYLCQDEVEKWVHKELGPCRVSGNRYACGGGHLIYFSGPCEELKDGHYNCKNLVNKKIAKENINCLDSLDSSGWYNKYEPLENWDDSKHVERALIESMGDLDQRNPEMKQYLIDASKHWLDLGVDGFRIDGVKHIYKDFLSEFEQAMAAHKPEIILIGEYYEGGHYDDKSINWLKKTDRYTMFDFFFSKNMHNYFRGQTGYLDHGSLEAFDVMLTNRPKKGYNFWNKLKERSNELITFINNHDSPRLLSEKDATIDHYKAALKLMFTSRGIPTLLYGDEIGLAVPNDRRYDTMILGIGGDPWNRLMMRWDHIPETLELDQEEEEEEDEDLPVYDFEWYGDFVSNGYRFPSDEVLLTPEELRKKEIRDTEIVREKEIYNLTKKLIKLRRSSNLFRFGHTRLLRKYGLLDNLQFDPTPYNFLAFERSILGGISKEDDQLCYYFWSDKIQTLRYKVELSDGIYTDAIEENSEQYKVVDGIIELEMKPQQVIVITKGIPSIRQTPQQSETVKVTLKLTIDKISSGQQVYITGQDQILGKWVGTEAIGPLKRKGYGKYQMTLHLPRGMHSQFKFIKLDKHGHQEWETIPNRLLYIYRDGQIIEGHWNSLN